MLSVADLPDPLSRQVAVEMRDWVLALKPTDAEKLNLTGKIIFSWDALEASYPDQARITDDYEEQRRRGIVEVFNQQSKPVPQRLAAHHDPDTVEIARKHGGECWVVVSSTNGIEHCYLEVAAPSPRMKNQAD